MTDLSSSSVSSNYEMTELAKAVVKGDTEKSSPSAEDREKYPILSMLEQLNAQVTEQLDLPEPMPALKQMTAGSIGHIDNNIY